MYNKRDSYITKLQIHMKILSWHYNLKWRLILCDQRLMLIKTYDMWRRNRKGKKKALPEKKNQMISHSKNCFLS